MHSIIFYQGSAHGVWKQISRNVPKLYTVHTLFQFLNYEYKFLKINIKSLDCVNVTDKTISALAYYKQSGNKYDESNNCEKNASVNNKSADKKGSKQDDEKIEWPKRNTCSQKSNAKRDTYLNNSPPLTYPLGGGFFGKLIMVQLVHTKCSRVEKTLLRIIYEPSWPEIITIGGL